MSTIHIYLNIHKPTQDNSWLENFTSNLEKIGGVDDAMGIGQNDSKDLQLNLDFDINLSDFRSIERLIIESGGRIVSMDVHFPHEVTGISDAYGASGVSLLLTDKIKEIAGVLGSSMSSSGFVKVELVPAAPDKNSILQQILEIITRKKTNS